MLLESKVSHPETTAQSTCQTETTDNAYWDWIDTTEKAMSEALRRKPAGSGSVA